MKLYGLLIRAPKGRYKCAQGGIKSFYNIDYFGQECLIHTFLKETGLTVPIIRVFIVLKNIFH